MVPPGERTSFLVNVTADPATAALVHTRGFAFRPRGETVMLYYSTATCGEFYRSRERVGDQVCGGGAVEAVTDVLPGGLPFDTLCGVP